MNKPFIPLVFAVIGERDEYVLEMWLNADTGDFGFQVSTNDNTGKVVSKGDQSIRSDPGLRELLLSTVKALT